MTEAKKKWDDESVATLMTYVNNSGETSVENVEAAAAALGVSARSVAAKVRQLGYAVASMAKVKQAAFNDEETAALVSFVEGNSGAYTYKQIAEQFMGGKFDAKKIQGKVLALELTSHVKPAEKVEVARTYTEAEEAKFVEMAKSGAYIEDIASALSKEIASARGKALSLSRAGKIDKIPAQRESHKKNAVDPVDALGDKLATMTVAEIATAVDKTERGIRTLLTRRGIKVADYDGQAKRAKAEAAKAEAAA